MAQAAEDHASGAGLEGAGYGDAYALADVIARLVHDDHGAVVEIADALGGFVTGADDFERQFLAGQDHGAQGVGEVVEVDGVNVLDFGEFGKVVVAGEDARLELVGEADEFAVNGAAARGAAVVDLDGDAAFALEALEHFESAASAVTAQAVAGVGDVLQFLEDEFGHDEGGVEDAGVAEVGEAAVNDGAGVNEDGARTFFFLLELDVGDNEAEAILGFVDDHDAEEAAADDEGEFEHVGEVVGVHLDVVGEHGLGDDEGGDHGEDEGENGTGDKSEYDGAD